MDPARGRRDAARARGAAALRGHGPLLPLALRAALQLRADVGTPGRVDLLGPLRGGPAVRRAWTTSSPGRTAPTPTSSRTRPATRRWASTRCGRCATSSRASRARRCCPRTSAERLRLEDLLGFRRNPISATPLFKKFGAKPLDGHPTPAVPFVRLSTGASGVGLASSIGLALAAREYYGAAAPRVHVVEGEGGLTPGRVAEALAAAGARLARQRRLPRRLEPGVDRLEPRLPRGRASRATTCSGRRWSCSTCTTGTWSRCRTAGTSRP